MVMGWSKGKPRVLSPPKGSLLPRRAFGSSCWRPVSRNCFLKIWSLPGRLVSFLQPSLAKLNSDLPWALPPYLCSETCLLKAQNADLSSRALHPPFATPLLSLTCPHLMTLFLSPEWSSQLWLSNFSVQAQLVKSTSHLAAKSHRCTISESRPRNLHLKQASQEFLSDVAGQ